MKRFFPSHKNIMWKSLQVVFIVFLGFGVNADQRKPFVTSSDAVSCKLGIVGGQNASIESFPYMAAAFNGKDFVGSAVILNKHWLLTTAYIVVGMDFPDLVFRVGSDYYNSGGTVLKTKDYKIHMNYTGSLDWDIAVVRVDKPIKFGKSITAAKISHKELKGGRKALIAGWGSNINSSSTTPSVILQQANVTVLSKKKCQSSTSYKPFSSRMMCTFDANTGPVVNDFGDPLVLGNVVYGLFAGGTNLKPSTEPLLYTDVSKYYKWIKKSIRD